jgi:hypothetical protein
MKSEPEFLICVDCQTPCYTFEWKNEKLAEATCIACGADDLETFMTQEDYEAMESG